MSKNMAKMKDLPRVVDCLTIEGGAPSSDFRGMRMPDGSPVPVEHIMRTHGVDRNTAIRIARRQTR